MFYQSAGVPLPKDAQFGKTCFNNSNAWHTVSSVSSDTIKTASGMPEQAVVADSTNKDVLNLSNER